MIMAFSKKTIIELLLFDIPWRRTVQHFQGVQLFPGGGGPIADFYINL